MTPNLHPFLINDPFGDPGLYLQLPNEKRSIIFDIGDISSLTTKQVLCISHIFVTHTHIDHFFGIDKIIRLFLGKEKTLNIYGPKGLFKNIQGKLAGYNWNLINTYKHNFKICTTEIYKNHYLTRVYETNSNFKMGKLKKVTSKNNIILMEKKFYVIANILNHGTPCIGYSFKEKSKIKILKNKLYKMNLLPGKWINKLKELLYQRVNEKNIITLKSKDSKIVKIDIKTLKEKITYSIPGQKITYISDIIFSNENKENILKLAYKSNHLFIEASFMTKDKNIAAQKYHLTAKQAGKIARLTKSKKYTLFHHSPRYTYLKKELNYEAEKEFLKYT